MITSPASLALELDGNADWEEAMSVLQSADGRPYPAADAALQRAFDSAREIMQGHLESTHSVYSNSCWQVLLSLLSVRSGQSSSSADAPSSAEGNRSAS